jgi:hypothetical protein
MNELAKAIYIAAIALSCLALLIAFDVISKWVVFVLLVPAAIIGCVIGFRWLIRDFRREPSE